MLTPLNIVSFDQGKTPARSEAEYYSRATELKAPAWLGRLLGWLTRTRAGVPAAEPAQPQAAIRR
jgi:hypothetical protein